MTAMAARSSRRVADCSSASRTTGTMARRCSREASSGTTPPYLACVANLRRDHRRQNAAAILDHGRGGFIARRFDSQDAHWYGEVWICLSSIMTCRRASIAQEPLADRAASRMLVVYREERRWEDRIFREFPEFLRAGRLPGAERFEGVSVATVGPGTGVHSLPVERQSQAPQNLSGQWKFCCWNRSAMIRRPGPRWCIRAARCEPASAFCFDDVEAEIIGAGRVRRAHGAISLRRRYIRRARRDRARSAAAVHQAPGYGRGSGTIPDGVRARAGSVAAPTAGLHFTAGDSGCLPRGRRRDRVCDAARGAGNISAGAWRVAAFRAVPDYGRKCREDPGGEASRSAQAPPACERWRACIWAEPGDRSFHPAWI